MKTAICSAALLMVLCASGHALAADQDHGGQDVTISADDTWDGTHTGIKTLTVQSGSTLKVTAGQMLQVFAERIVIDGSLDANGAGNAGVSGASDTGKDGIGPGAGKKGGVTMFGGGGAAYAGAGGCGRNAQGCTGAGGTPYGAATDGLVELGSSGGSSGGIAAQSPGASSGAGGGAVLLSANEIDISGTLSADGAAGATVNYSGTKAGGGGGSGGGLVLIAGTFGVTGTVTARGGAGGEASCTPLNIPCSPGGGGGGGWVKVLYWGANPNLAPDVTGGAGGAHPAFSGSSGADGTVVTDALATIEPDTNSVTGSGSIPVSFKLLDPDSDPCALEVTFVQNGVSKPASLVGVTDPDAGLSLTSSPAGTPNSIIWLAGTDLPGFTGSVELQMRAHDGFGFGPPSSVTVTLGGATAGDGGNPQDDGGTNPPGDGGTNPATGGGSSSGGCACSWANRDAGAPNALALFGLLAGLLLRRSRPIRRARR